MPACVCAGVCVFVLAWNENEGSQRERERDEQSRGGGICVRTRNECKEGCGRLCAVLYTWCTSTPILLYVSSLVRAHQPCGKRRLVVGFDFPVASRYPAPRADMPVVTLTGERRVEEVLPVLARVSMMGILEVSYPGFPDLFSSLSLSLSLSSFLHPPSSLAVNRWAREEAILAHPWLHVRIFDDR